MSESNNIYTGFAEGVQALNQTVVSDLMVMTKAGRAYRGANGKPYVDRVHIKSIGEDSWTHRELMRAFDRRGGGHGEVYMGAAGFLNLSFIAALRPSAAILYDINITQTLFWDDIIGALKENKTLKGFIDFLQEEHLRLKVKLKNFFNKTETATRDDFHPSQKKVLTNIFSGEKTSNPYDVYRTRDPSSWIQSGLQEVSAADQYWMTEKCYSTLHALAKGGAIGALTLDVMDKKACAQLKEHLDQKAVHVQTLYISNIFNFLAPNARSHTRDFADRPLEKTVPWIKKIFQKNAGGKKAVKNLQPLLAENAQIIHDHPTVENLTWPIPVKEKRPPMVFIGR